MSQTYACVVGTNRDGLTAARADALKIARALYLYGVPTDNIAVFLDEMATPDAVLQQLGRFAEVMRPDDQIFFYYAGHGRCEGAQSALELSQAPLPLSTLLGALTQMAAAHAFVVMDACHLRIDRFELSLDDRCLQALSVLLPAANAPTYEDKLSGAGEFTHLFLVALAKVLPHSEVPYAELVQQLTLLCLQEGLSMPVYYRLGMQPGYFLPLAGPAEPSNQVVPRRSCMRMIQELLTESLNPVVWIWGPGGLGKSTLMKQVCAGPSAAVYTTVPKAMPLKESTLHCLFTQIPPQLPQHYPPHRPVEPYPEEALFGLQRRASGLMWIIDHAERLDVDDCLSLMILLAKMDLPVIAVSRFPPPTELKGILGDRLLDWQPPKLSIGETEQLIRATTSEHYDARSLHLTCEGNPLKLKQVLSHLELKKEDAVAEQDDLHVTLAALYAAGSFVDEQLFCEVFEIHPNSVQRLRKMGMIDVSEQVYYPHDLLLEVAENEGLDCDGDRAVTYWARQVLAIPTNMHACRSLLLMISRIETEALPIDALLEALDTLRGKENRDLLTELAEALAGRHGVEALAIPLIQQLIDYDCCEEAHALIRTIKESSPIMARLLTAQISWWQGSFHASIQACESVLAESQDQIPREYAHANLGLAYFFLGDWEASKKHLAFLLVQGQATSPMFLGWAQCITGTILALRGEDIVGGTHLLREALHTFQASRNFNWQGHCWNNLGEVYWKTGKYPEALEALVKCTEIVDVAQNFSTAIEARRNMIHVRLRTQGPSSIEVHRLMNEIQELSARIEDSFEEMQYLNTFATVYAHRGDIRLLEETLDRLTPLTEGNHEYHIYTLANRSLLHGLKGEPELASSCLEQAIELARQGGNLLAIRQIMEDTRQCKICVA